MYAPKQLYVRLVARGGERIRRIVGLVGFVASILLIPLVLTAPVLATDEQPDRLSADRVTAERATYGLSTGQDMLEAIRAHGDDWPVSDGIPLLPSEADLVDPTVCAMGFHISIGGDEQMTTAGHCSYGHMGTTWYTAGVVVGTVLNSQLDGSCSYLNPCRDLERVQMSDDQASFKVYAGVADTFVESMDNPLDGETICASLAKTNDTDCGTVVDHALGKFQWAEIGGGWVSGMASVQGVDAQPGDSGSPFYHRIGSSEDVVALGSESLTNGSLEWITKILNPVNTVWGGDVVTDTD